jgi:coproporphyrinogen III oxidase
MSGAVAAAAAAYFRELQARICTALEDEERAAHVEAGRAVAGAVRFVNEPWQHADGGGGLTRVLSRGALFEQGGVNTSAVSTALPATLAATLPGDGAAVAAAGLSLVVHPRSPHVPTVHLNLRCLQRGATLWFGGGADLTPCYPVPEDVVHFHRVLKGACDRHDPDFYADFKRQCDEYFYLPHRGETRGVGGIFFDYLRRDPERDLAFVRGVGDAFLEAYVPIVRRRRGVPYGEPERQFQLLRRGRYVEFNLLYDRGTRFGLETGGRTESILMSLPPLARWEHGAVAAAGTPEAHLADWLCPRDWLGEAGARA